MGLMMTSLRFLQFVLLYNVLSSLFQVSWMSTTISPVPVSVNETSEAHTVSSSLPSSLMPSSETNSSILSLNETSSTIVIPKDIVTPSSNGSIPATTLTLQPSASDVSSSGTPNTTVANTAIPMNSSGENSSLSTTISFQASVTSVPFGSSSTVPFGSSSRISPVVNTASSYHSTASSVSTVSIASNTSHENTSLPGNSSTLQTVTTSLATPAYTTAKKNITENETTTTPAAAATTTTQINSTASVNLTTHIATTENPITSPVAASSETLSSTESTLPSTSVLSSSISTSPVLSSSAGLDVTSTGTTSNPPANASSGGDSSKGWIAAPVILGLAAIAAIVIVVVIIIRRKRKKDKEAGYQRRGLFGNDGVMNPSFRIDVDDNDRPRPPPVRVQDFIAHVAELHRDSDYGFANEFSLLGKLSAQHSKNAAELPENRTKNRFTNVLPFDHSRVRLIPVDDDEDGSDYINANFLPGFSSRREFIAAQGPMRSTVDDFWRMIWEYNITTVVMVTNLFERGREKCAQYWPDQNDPIYYGDVQVEQLSESSLNYYVIRIFSVTAEQKTRRLMQFQFLTWPDFGVPKEHDHLLSFLTQVRSSIPHGANQSILVHCSAGVGRTGTFIAIDHALQVIKSSSEIDVFGLVLDMRNGRSNMIQTEAQYIFVHECIRYALEHGYHQGKQDFLLNGGEDSSIDTQEDQLYMNSNERKK